MPIDIRVKIWYGGGVCISHVGGSELKNRAGFTTGECLLVFVIVSIIAIAFIVGVVLCLVRGRNAAQAKTCVANLKQIDAAIEQWAFDFKKDSDDTPDIMKLTTEGKESGMYLKEWPVCPSGGVYWFGSIADKPTCDFRSEFRNYDRSVHKLP